MKRIGEIICYVFAGILIILSLVFAFIEGHTLFSGDWLLFENQVNGFFRYFFRLLIALFALANSIVTYFALRKNASMTLRLYFYFGSLSIFLSSLIISYFASNYLDLAFRIVGAIYFLGSALIFATSHEEIKITKKDQER